MAEQRHLWVFEDFEKNTTFPHKIQRSENPSALGSVGPAPLLRPEFTNDDIFQLFSKRLDKHSYTVNVVKDFPWTSSPQNAESIGDVPELHLRELNVEFNPFLNQILNNIAVIRGGVTSIANEETKAALQSLIKGLGDIKKQEPQKEKKNIFDKLEDLISDTTEFIAKTSNAIKNFNLKNFVTGAKINDPDYDPMTPYERLYETSPTGWKYRLPFFDDNFRNISNAWGSAANMSILGGVASAAQSAANLASQIGNIAEPGTYIEKIPGYTFGGGKRSVQVSFPLINTRTYDEVIRNWQLIFLLTYQNLPNRVSRSMIIPPVIYEALIPGTWYSKYCYISNLTVSFIGARRKMKLRIPTVTKNVLDDFLLGQTDIETIVPDAYNVTMTVSELFAEAQNHMYTALTKRNLNSKVRTGEMDSSGTILDAALSTAAATKQDIERIIGG